MNEYVKQAQDFLKACNATMRIRKLGCSQNTDWNDKFWRNVYIATIETPIDTMIVRFWDSAYNTEQGIEPTEYDILSCLQKYDVGTIDDFVSDFGYEVHKWSDVKKIQRMYNAVVKEYNDICRCFSPEQIELLRDIT